jgi:nicotinamidase-related amidase
MLQPDRTLLVVVDLQEKLLPAIPERERVVRNSRLLLRLAREVRLPVLFTTQYSKGLGVIAPDIRAEAPAAQAFDKTSFGCFGDEAIGGAVEASDRDQLLVCGIETHICVAQTVLGAFEKGYEVHVCSDAVGSRTPENHRVGLGRMERAGAVVSSAEMAVYELLGRSDSPAFKAMLPLLKA